MATKRLKKGEIKNLIEKYIETMAKTELLETEEFLQHQLLEKVGHCDPRSIRAAMVQIQQCQEYPETFDFLLTKKVSSYSEECYHVIDDEIHMF